MLLLLPLTSKQTESETMTVFTNSMYRVEQVSIPYDYTTSKTQYFVDTLDGKNMRVFDTKEEAVTWAIRRG